MELHCLFDMLIFFPLDMYHILGLLWMVLLLCFLGVSMLIYIKAILIDIPTNNMQGFSFLSYLHQLLLSLMYLVTAILTGERWYLIELLILIFIMITDFEHFSYTCLAVICLLLRNVYLYPLPIFKWFVFLPLTCVPHTLIRHIICKYFLTFPKLSL